MMTRRDYLKQLGTIAAGASLVQSGTKVSAKSPIAAGSANVWQPIIDLHFADDSGLAQWWVPELVLLGNTDVSLRARGRVDWQQYEDGWRYQHVNSDLKLSLSVTVNRIEHGWLASLTVRNQTKENWPDVVCPVCLLLRASGSFEDVDWTRTYFRSDGKFLPYHGQKTDGGQPIYRMSLVKGRTHIERTERHKNKWGFTKQLSDDGIIGVVSQDSSTVLTTAWTRTHHLQANLKRTFSCIHANPYFGPIGPGESCTMRGCVQLTAGSLDEAWTATQKTLNDIET